MKVLLVMALCLVVAFGLSCQKKVVTRLESD